MLSRYKKLYTATELAKMLHVHINTVRRWNNRGVINAYRVGPRRDRRFDKDEILRFLEENPDM